MKRLSTLQLIPGMIVAENILTYDHQLVLSKGTVLTDKTITRLDLYGILTIYVEDSTPAPSGAPASAMEQPSYSERVINSPEFKRFRKEYQKGLESLKDTINNVVRRNMKLDVPALLQNCLDIIAGSRGQIGTIDMLWNMREYDDSTFAHCMNVALISNIFTTWLKWPKEDVEMATACGLLHDIGKLSVPYAILTKPGKLSAEEYEQIKRHPISGYQMLLAHNVDEHILYAALMHHERNDGTGYPMHLTGKQIDRFARVIAIADVYDAMTSSRVYRGPLCPFRVIEIFEAEGFQKYDVEYLLPFLENVVNTYIRNRCLLSDGRAGDIIYVNKSKLSRPIVQCGTEYVNLSECPDLAITRLL